MPTPANFLERASLAEARAARATNAAMKEAFLKVAAAWRRVDPGKWRRTHDIAKMSSD